MSIHEEHDVFGAFPSQRTVAAMAYYGLYAFAASRPGELRHHRGDDGISSQDLGLVNDVFSRSQRRL